VTTSTTAVTGPAPGKNLDVWQTPELPSGFTQLCVDHGAVEGHK
jgi:hypothetical protein